MQLSALLFESALASGGVSAYRCVPAKSEQYKRDIISVS